MNRRTSSVQRPNSNEFPESSDVLLLLLLALRYWNRTSRRWRSSPGPTPDGLAHDKNGLVGSDIKPCTSRTYRSFDAKGKPEYEGTYEDVGQLHNNKLSS